MKKKKSKKKNLKKTKAQARWIDFPKETWPTIEEPDELAFRIHMRHESALRALINTLQSSASDEKDKVLIEELCNCQNLQLIKRRLGEKRIDLKLSELDKSKIEVCEFAFYANYLKTTGQCANSKTEIAIFVGTFFQSDDTKYLDLRGSISKAVGDARIDSSNLVTKHKKFLRVQTVNKT